MIEYTTGDLLKSDADALVNTVNCVGVMGRGIALQFKKAFPDNFKAYKAACDREDVRPGKMFVFERQELVGPRYIINFPTKRHWKGKSRIEDVTIGLKDLANEIRERDIGSIAIPPLGSGLGGLNWPDVRREIEIALSDLSDVRIIVFEPSGAPEVVKSKEMPKMTPGRAALVALMDRYLGGLMDPFVTLLEVHKLMYFMQEAGQPLQLRYEKGPYGPYAKNLGHVLNAVEGHLVSGDKDGGDQPDKQLELVPGAREDANAQLMEDAEVLTRFDLVADLVEGFETPFGMELLATVHWVARQEGANSVEEAVSRIYSWNERKRQFTPRQIEIAYQTLSHKQWLPNNIRENA